MRMWLSQDLEDSLPRSLQCVDEGMINEAKNNNNGDNSETNDENKNNNKKIMSLLIMAIIVEIIM